MTELIPTHSLLAYIDGGTGSMVFQVLIAGVLGVGVTLKAYWTHIRGFLARTGRK